MSIVSIPLSYDCFLKRDCAKARQFAILHVFIDLFFLNRTAPFYYVLLFRNTRFGSGLRGVFVLYEFPLS